MQLYDLHPAWFTLGVWNNASVASYLLAKEFTRDGIQISTELSKCICLCLQHFVLLPVDPFSALEPTRNAKSLLSQNTLMELLLEQHGLCLCPTRMA
jgi:hypothetical protein